jgi:hypothetical protein
MVKRTLVMIGTALVVSGATAWAQQRGTAIGSFGYVNGVAAVASTESAPAAEPRPAAAMPILIEFKRPRVLPMLYVSLGVAQALDIMTTTKALQAGGREQNPVMAPFAKNTGAMIAIKAATTAATIIAVEKMWKKNRVGAIAMAVVANGAVAAVAAYNTRVIRAQRAR